MISPGQGQDVDARHFAILVVTRALFRKDVAFGTQPERENFMRAGVAFCWTGARDALGDLPMSLGREMRSVMNRRRLRVLAGQLELDVTWCARDNPFMPASLTVVGDHEQVMSAIHSDRYPASRFTLGTIGLATFDVRVNRGHYKASFQRHIRRRARDDKPTIRSGGNSTLAGSRQSQLGGGAD